MINGDAAFGEEFLHVAVGQAVAQIPAHRDRDHLTRESIPGRRDNDGFSITNALSSGQGGALRTVLYWLDRLRPTRAKRASLQRRAG
jgi:hypothetical protein